MTGTTAIAATTVTREGQDQLSGHSKGVDARLFNRDAGALSFHGMTGLLTPYLVKHHGYPDAEGLTLLSAHGDLACAPPYY